MPPEVQDHKAHCAPAYVQSKASIEEQESGKGGEPGHRTWNSFGSNGGAGDSPFIGAHYGSSAVSRGPSNDLAAMDDDACIAPLRNELLHLRHVLSQRRVSNAASSRGSRDVASS